jgi:hypothetical protein
MSNVVQLKPEPITLEIETRPSNFTGYAYWAVLSYKEHRFEELLPQDIGAKEEAEFNRYVEQAATRLKAQLRPIIMAEDGE